MGKDKDGEPVDFEDVALNGLKDLQKAVGKLTDQVDELKKAVTAKAEDPPATPAITIGDVSKAVQEHTGMLKSSVEEMLKSFMGDLKKESATVPKVEPEGQKENLAKEAATEPPINPEGQKKDLAKQEPTMDECMEMMRSGKEVSEPCKQKLAEAKKAFEAVAKAKAEDKDMGEPAEDKDKKIEKQKKDDEVPLKGKEKPEEDEVVLPLDDDVPPKKMPPEDEKKADDISKSLDNAHLVKQTWRETIELVEGLKPKRR